MNYPNKVIKKGEKNKSIVRALQEKLNEKGCGPIEVDGDFGRKTFNAVKLFQVRFQDQNGNNLVVDGEVGQLTWGALFGKDTLPAVIETDSPLLKEVIEVASAEVGVMEDPVGSNGGLKVEEYLGSVGLDEGNPWCAAFVYWCFSRAAAAINVKNRLVKTGGVLNHWNSASCKKISSDSAYNNPELVRPGYIFIIGHSGGTGHTGFVEKVANGMITTIEGNTNEGGGREGIGVFRRARKFKEINKGFLAY